MQLRVCVSYSNTYDTYISSYLIMWTTCNSNEYGIVELGNSSGVSNLFHACSRVSSSRQYPVKIVCTQFMFAWWVVNDDGLCDVIDV